MIASLEDLENYMDKTYPSLDPLDKLIATDKILIQMCRSSLPVLQYLQIKEANYILNLITSRYFELLPDLEGILKEKILPNNFNMYVTLYGCSFSFWVGLPSSEKVKFYFERFLSIKGLLLEQVLEHKNNG